MDFVEPVSRPAKMFALLGPTASGKSDVATVIARNRIAVGRPTEIVAIDAFTVYREMDIATAKPSHETRNEIPHHMIDVYTPDQDVTVALFQRDARDVIERRHAAGVDLILVGGSGLYWRAVVDDLRFPPTEAELRAALERRYPTNDEAYGALRTKDPETADALDVNNYRRVIRALEVNALTGESFMAFQQNWDTFTSRYDSMEVAYLHVETEVLTKTIAHRSQAMVSNGLLDEAKGLREHWELSRTAAQAIGYHEAFGVLDGQMPLDALADAVSQRTRRYAKRQRTWFRQDPRCINMSAEAITEGWSAP